MAKNPHVHIVWGICLAVSKISKMPVLVWQRQKVKAPSGPKCQYFVMNSLKCNW